MEKLNISENEAYHMIRKQATKERKSLKQVAEAIITTNQIADSS